jgi:hypothetical protein
VLAAVVQSQVVSVAVDRRFVKGGGFRLFFAFFAVWVRFLAYICDLLSGSIADVGCRNPLGV